MKRKKTGLLKAAVKTVNWAVANKATLAVILTGLLTLAGFETVTSPPYTSNLLDLSVPIDEIGENQE